MKNWVLTLFLFSFGFSFQISLGQVLEYDTHIDIDKKARMTTTVKVLSQINSKEESDLASVNVYHKTGKEFKLNYAKVLNFYSKELRELKSSDLKTRSYYASQSFHTDALITSFELYWHQYPYLIEYSYTIVKNDFITIANWSPYFNKLYPTLKSSLTLNTPIDYEYSCYVQNIGNFFSDINEKRKTQTWKVGYFSFNDQEIYGQSSDIIPNVIVAPSQFRYGIDGSNDSWQLFGKWYNNLNYGADELNKEECEKINLLVHNLSTKNEIVKTIYHYLQDQTKYLNIDLELGGLKSYSANYVCKNKYGDCKALTTYMKAMLKSQGIESKYVIINAGSYANEIDTSSHVSQFNHVVLMVPMEEDTLWLENTSNSLPFNYLGTFTQDRFALIIDKNKSKMVRTPKISLSEALSESVVNMHIGADENKLDLKLSLRANYFETLRYYISNNLREKQESFISGLFPLESYEFDSINYPNFNRDSTFIEVRAKATSKAPVSTIGKYTILNPISISIPNFENPEDRKTKVLINYPINEKYHTNYILEAYNNSNIELPENLELNSKFGSYSISFHEVNNVIQVSEHFILFAQKIDLDDYPEFFDFIKIINHSKERHRILLR